MDSVCVIEVTVVFRGRDAKSRFRDRPSHHFAAVASISIMSPGNASFETPSNVPGG